MKQVINKIKRFNFKLWVPIVGSIVLLIGAFIAVEAINNFFDKNYLQFNKVLTVILKVPVEIKKRVPQVKTLVLDYPGEIDTPIKKYICDKFGPYDCKVALAINASEGNFVDEVFHVNNNSTIDFGCWQINQIHIKSGSITAKDALDCYKATDWAFNKFKRDGGWGAWVGYTSGKYLAHYGE